MDIFGSEAIAKNFEEQEIDGRILLSQTVQTNEAMETLGLKTIGKRGKFLEKTKELAGMMIPHSLAKLLRSWMLFLLKGATSPFLNLKDWLLIFKIVIFNPFQSSPSSAILVSFCFSIIPLVFFLLSTLLFLGFPTP